MLTGYSPRYARSGRDTNILFCIMIACPSRQGKAQPAADGRAISTGCNAAPYWTI